MGRRTVLLVLALLAAALGTLAVFLYVDKADERALKDQSPVDVLVAKTIIKAGTLASDAERQGAFKLATLPRSAVIEGAMTSITPISSLVAVGDIFAGEQIIPAKFSAVGTSGALPVPAGKLGVTVQLGDPERVAGFVQPGSDIAVFVTIPKQGNTPAFTRMLLPRVQVIAVGPTTLRPTTTDAKDANREAVPTALLTLAVDQTQATKIIFAKEQGKLHFGLLTKDSKVSPGSPIELRNLFT